MADLSKNYLLGRVLVFIVVLGQNLLLPNFLKAAQHLGDEKSPELIEAVKDRDLKRLQQLLKRGADPNVRGVKGRSPLYWACLEKDPVYVAELLLANADPGITDDRGMSPIHVAAKENKPKHLVLLVLMADKEKINAKCTKFGLTPLHNAVIHKNEMCMQILLEVGADPNIQSTQSCNTALGFAVTSNNIKVFFQMLLAAGADPYIKNAQGQTVFHLVAERGLVDHVQDLFACETSPYDKNAEGLTPYDLACKYGHTGCAKVINDTCDSLKLRRESVYHHCELPKDICALIAGYMDGSSPRQALDFRSQK